MLWDYSKGDIKMRIYSKLKNLTNRISLSFKRFPISLLLATLSVAVVIFMNHNDYNLRDTYSRIAMTLALGIPLSLSLYVYFEGKSHIKKHFQMLSHAGVLVLLVLYYFVLLKDLNMVGITRYIAYTISFYLLFTFIPYLHRKEDYELYIIRLFNRFVVTYLYSMVLYLGIVAILATINLLFSAGISGRFFFDIAIIVAGIFAPAFFLSDVPKRDEKLPIENYPKVLGVLLQFIILPLLSIYTIILYIYFGKSIVTMQLPQGVIGNLVLWYSIISAIILFFIYPLRNTNQWIKSFMVIFPKTIIPLLAMMFMAIGIRIKAYGITESRYFVLVVGLWVSGVMIYYAIKKDINNIYISISLAIIGFLAVTGPLSAYSISQISQNNRFQEILLRYDMIDENLQIKGSQKDLAEADEIEVSEILRYFNNYHSLDKVKYLPEGFEISQMKNILGFDLRDGGGFDRNREYFGHYWNAKKALVDIKEFDYFTECTSYEVENPLQINEDYTILYENNEELVIKYREKTIYNKNLKQIARDIHEKNRGQDNPSEDEISFYDENQMVKVYIIFKDINGFENLSRDEIEIEGINYYVFVKVK